MSLFGLGKKKEEVKIEPACACNGEVATYEHHHVAVAVNR